MESVFNVGCGMIAVIHKDSGARFEKATLDLGLKVQALGDICFPKSRENLPAEVVYES
jgi:phosphoribosylaminoimidazole (AIR) synthetase